MRRLIFLVLINVFLTKNVVLSDIYNYPTNQFDACPSDLNQRTNKVKNETQTVCQTPECQKIANLILESIDKSSDPCDDFYAYACGKWKEHNPMPNGRVVWNLKEIVQRNIMQRISKILKAEPKDDDIVAVKLLKRWYTTCMDTDAMEKQGLDQLVFTLSRAGGWPIIMYPDEWDEKNDYEWHNLDDYYARLSGRNAFHNIYIAINDYTGYSEDKPILSVPQLPSGLYRLWRALSLDEDTTKSNESDKISSAEEAQNFTQKDSQPREDFSFKKRSIRKTRATESKRDTEINSNYSSQETNDHGLKQTIMRKLTADLSRPLTDQNGLNMQTRMRNNINTNVEYTSTVPLPAEKDKKFAKELRQKYVDYISKVARALAKASGKRIPDYQIDYDVQDLINFQLKLAKIIFDYSHEPRESMTLCKFQRWYDDLDCRTPDSMIDWEYKISELTGEAGLVTSVKIVDIEMDIPKRNYFSALVSLLDQTSSRTIVNYVHWNFISHILRTTTNEMRELFNSWLGIKENKAARSRRCIEEAKMEEIVSYEYVRNFFSDNIIQSAMNMFDDIEKEMEYQIKESSWMREDIKDYILTKLKNIQKFVGYPSWYNDTSVVKNYFQRLIVGKSYYENIVNYGRYSKLKNLLLLQEDDPEMITGIPKGQTNQKPEIPNAFYTPDNNSITIMAAYFESPFFDYNRPQLINFGIIGTIIAHKINHIYIDRDRLYDNKNDEHINWQSSIVEEYNKRENCFIDQYDNYLMDKNLGVEIKNYDDQMTKEEIADTVGLRAAFGAYRRREKLCGSSNVTLPGLEEFTNDQLFFLSYSSLWCEMRTHPTIEVMLDTYSTGRSRLIRSVSNSEDFAKAFNCPVGSMMNPEKKCDI